jgi:anti-anti-sigma regulatory factor
LRACSLEEQENKRGAEGQDFDIEVIFGSRESLMLRITSHENAQSVHLKLEGVLKGVWVQEMEQCWRKAYSDRSKALIVDLSDVDFVDTAGRYLLALIHAHGASFVTVTPMMTELIAEISAGSDLPQ